MNKGDNKAVNVFHNRSLERSSESDGKAMSVPKTTEKGGHEATECGSDVS